MSANVDVNVRPDPDPELVDIADYVSASGRELEGDGVTPDEVVTLDRQALLRGADPVLDAALRWIAAQ